MKKARSNYIKRMSKRWYLLDRGYSVRIINKGKVRIHNMYKALEDVWRRKYSA